MKTAMYADNGTVQVPYHEFIAGILLMTNITHSTMTLEWVRPTPDAGQEAVARTTWYDHHEQILAIQDIPVQPESGKAAKQHSWDFLLRANRMVQTSDTRYFLRSWMPMTLGVYTPVRHACDRKRGNTP